MPFRYGCVVDGEYFCPRPELERQLRNYAESGQNLVIQEERRMGKTSLVKKALAVVFAREKNGFENAIADLTPNQETGKVEPICETRYYLRRLNGGLYKESKPKTRSA